VSIAIGQADPASSATTDSRLRALRHKAAGELVVHEIYRSLQGEGTHAGLPCVFIRLTSCHLRCTYCDTRHAFHQGEAIETVDILARVEQLLQPGDLIEVTGGEPLLQEETRPLLGKLADTGHLVLLETSGSLEVLDLKTPGSGEVTANDWSNLDRLQPTDEIKFVVVNRADFEWTVDQVKRHSLHERFPVLVAPAHERVSPADLATWILESGMPLRLQLQLHKQVWGTKTRGV
jgi:7-carboxy-7-deazaguanine synthase